MATNHESTTTPPASAQPTEATIIPSGDCLIHLGSELLHYTPVPYAALSEKLDELDRTSGNMPMFRDACIHIATVYVIVWCGNAYQIDGVTVRPTPARVGWPWCCTCGDTRCWHAAFCEALELVREQQATDGNLVRVA